MLNRIKQYMLQNYFGKHFPLQHRVYMIFFFETYAMSIPSALTNTLLHKGIAGVIFQWGYVVFCTVMAFLVPRNRLTFQKPHLLFVAFVYVPFLYFQAAGYDGTALLFSLLAVFLLGIVFTGKARILIIALNLLEYLVCILASYRYPQTVTPHGSPQAELLDLLVALTLTFIGLSIMTVFISRVFEDNSKALLELSIHDELTGVYNRRYLTEFLQRELEAAKQTNGSVYLLMLDIDHFKRINDSYGHRIGDRVLTACVRAMQSALSERDMLARYGGDEFAVVLHAQTPESALEVAERARRVVEATRFESGVLVTVSIGIERSRAGDSIEDLLTRADHCMYQAKQNGRNQVVKGRMMSSAA